MIDLAAVLDGLDHAADWFEVRRHESRTTVAAFVANPASAPPHGSHRVVYGEAPRTADAAADVARAARQALDQLEVPA